MRKITSLVIVIGLTASMQSTWAASPKVGTACTTKNAQVKTSNSVLKCVLVGKKLQWKLQPTSAAPTAAAAPKPTATPAPAQPAQFSPWSSNSTDEIVSAALANSDKYFGTVTPSDSYKFIVDPKITAEDRTWISKLLNYTNGAFSKVKREEILAFLGTNHEWSKTTLRANGVWVGDPAQPVPCSDGSRDTYCAEKNVVLLIYSDIYGYTGIGSKWNWDVGRRSTPAHEVFHTIQYSLTGPKAPPSQPTYIPSWLIEGSANYYGYYAISKLGFAQYSDGRVSQIQNMQSYKTVIPLVEYQFNTTYKDGVYLNPYGIGQAATEWIIASVGFESLLNIFEYTKSENSFELGFKKATGLDLADFYSKFELARKKMKIGPGN